MHKAYCFAALLASVFVLLAAPGRAQDTPNKIKLLTQDTGWALFHSRLYWTTDFGKDWRDITPPGISGANDVFFLDTFNGWVLVSGPDAGDPNGGLRFTLLATSDGGNSWTTLPVELPGWNARQVTLGGRGTLDFVDATHGWIDLSIESSGAFNRGALFSTSDGGRTWNSVPAPVGFGTVEFISTQIGWVAGGPANSDLVVTRDGGKTWQHVRLAPPLPTTGAVMPSYGTPRFIDPRRGFLTVSFSRATVAAFATSDVGRTWRPVATLQAAAGRHLGDTYPLVIVDSTLLVPSRDEDGHRRLSRFPLSGTASPAPSALPTRTGVLAATFADVSRGWVSTGWIYATTDGGATWTDITPKPSRPGPSPPAILRRPGGVGGAPTLSGEAATGAAILTAGPGGGGGGGGSSPHTSAHLGFDAASVLPHTEMQTWWKYSPYYDVGFYIGGENTSYAITSELPSSEDPDTATQWVADVISYGWGVIPFYVGPQAPCACKYGEGTYPNCTDGAYGTLIPQDLNQAMSQGESEAAIAESDMQTLGLATTGAPIYADLEEYDSSYTWGGSATCGQYVQAYAEGWDYQLAKDKYTPGVYANSLDAQSDIWTASPKPKDIWVARYYDYAATIWGDDYNLTGGLADSTWQRGYRARQYLGNNSEVYGDTSSYQIDRDIEYAQVAGGSGSKSYTYAGVDFSDYAQGVPYGISDAGMGQVGAALDDMVGSYTTSGGQCGGFPWYGFRDDQGAFTSFLVNGGATVAHGINDLKSSVSDITQIVGEVATTCWYLSYDGFSGTLSNGFTAFQDPTPTGQQYPYNTNGTYLWSVNDDGMAVGVWEDPSYNWHAITYNVKTLEPPTEFTGPSGQAAGLTGINGLGQMLGEYATNSGAQQPFVYDNGNFNTFSSPCGRGMTFWLGQLNNNGWTAISCGGAGSFVYNDQSGALIPINDPSVGPSGTYSSCMTCVEGINDAGEVVGFYWTAAGVAHGFTAKPTPQ